jgi:hypothetical protein
MKQITLTQGFFAMVDDEDYEWLSKWKWCAHRVHRSVYAVRNRQVSDGPGPRQILMHRAILNPPDGMETDHFNGNGLDNRRQNLHPVTCSVNGANQRHPQNRKHDLPMGVHRSRRKFQAQIGIEGHHSYLGTFNTPEEASQVYMAARSERIAESMTKGVIQCDPS